MKTKENTRYCRAHLDSNGNWCGHNRDNPRYYLPPEQHGFRPDVLIEAQDNLKAFYFHPRQYLPSLELARESLRQERTEGRERDASVLQCILQYTELASLRVGVPLENGEFIPISLQFIATKLNMSLKRVWRSIKNLKRAGYLTVKRRFKIKKLIEGEAEYIGLVSIKCLSLKFFNELKIDIQKLSMRRKKAAARLKKRYKAYMEKVEQELTKAAKEAVRGSMSAISGMFTNKNRANQYKKNKQRRNQRQIDAVKEMEKKLHVKQQTLRRKLAELMKIPIHQNKSIEQLISENPELKELNQIEKALKI